LKGILGAAILLILIAWGFLGLAMMAGFSGAFQFANRLQAWSGLGVWFPTVYLLAIPILMVCALGLLYRNTKT
jgi:hypothetical protein